MVITHHITEDTLYVQLPKELDIDNRAAAALQIEGLIHTHRPGQVTIELPTRDPSPMTLSALARTHRMCQSLGIPLTAIGPGGQPRRLPVGDSAGATRSQRLEHGARHSH
ncbi:hypothetical protein ABZ128_12290 [Streptomyces sp. NPDC006326]|uniref:hypothetical protein n=1 Tax=Streptomyces sp. NPDC006326 TaxID=3156752 RepID=UPI0033BE8E86